MIKLINILKCKVKGHTISDQIFLDHHTGQEYWFCDRCYAFIPLYIVD